MTRILSEKKNPIEWLICVVFHRKDHNVSTNVGACKACGRSWRMWL